MTRRTRFASYSLCVDEGRILLTRIWENDPGAGRWTLPGGKIEWQETPQDAALRELWEETGLTGQIERPLGVNTKVFPPWRQHDELHAVRFVFEVSACGEPQVIEQGGSTTEARWFPLADVPGVVTTTLVDYSMTLIRTVRPRLSGAGNLDVGDDDRSSLE